MRVACPLTITEKRLSKHKPYLMYMWQSQVEIKRYFVAFSTALPCSKHCSVELLLKAGLIHYVDLHVSGIHASTLCI